MTADDPRIHGTYESEELVSFVRARSGLPAIRASLHCHPASLLTVANRCRAGCGLAHFLELCQPEVLRGAEEVLGALPSWIQVGQSSAVVPGWQQALLEPQEPRMCGWLRRDARRSEAHECSREFFFASM